MNGKVLRLAIILATLALLGAGLVRVGRRMAAAPPVGAPAPAFRLQALDGTSLSLADLQGKVVIVNLWASWCPPCLSEMPALERLHRELGKDGAVVVGVAADPGEADVRTIVARYG